MTIHMFNQQILHFYKLSAYQAVTFTEYAKQFACNTNESQENRTEMSHCSEIWYSNRRSIKSQL